MGERYIGEIKLFSGTYIPEDWALCDGHKLAIDQYKPLYALIGTRYGGDGEITFALPNLQSRITIGTGVLTPMTYLFTIPPTFKDSLNKSEFSSDLREEFKKNGITFFLYTPKVKTLETDSEWEIIDGRKTKETTYVIRKKTVDNNGVEEEQLEVFSARSLFLTGETGGTEKVALTEGDLPYHSHRPQGQTGNGMQEVPGGGVWASPNGKKAYLDDQADQDMMVDLIAPAGREKPETHNNMMPYLTLSYIIALDGIFPPRDGQYPIDGVFIGEVRLFAFDFAPSGWGYCNGSTLPVWHYMPLFSLIQNTYGGDGRRTFALPNLGGRAPVHRSNEISLGKAGGTEYHFLYQDEMPAHTHQVSGTTATANSSGPKGRVWATSPEKPFATTPDTTMSSSAISFAGGGGSLHENMQPYFALPHCIALNGQYPPRP